MFCTNITLFLLVLFLITENYAQDHSSICKYRMKDPGRHCIDIEEAITTDVDRQAVLDKINSRRNKVAVGDIKSFPAAANMLKLEWNSDLEISAQKWAKQCVQSSVPDIKDACRHLGDDKVGQNIATIFGDSPGLKPTTLVDLWYMELLNINSSFVTKYKESKNTGNSHYDYFTQLVWSESRQVGCGSVKFKERIKDSKEGLNRTVYRLVCNFMPEGNRLNQSVYMYGAPCSRCPKGTSCDTVYKALCGPKLKRETKHTKKHKSVMTTSTSPSTYKTTTTSQTTANTETTFPTTEEETFTPFDYFSHLHEFTRQAITKTSQTKCKDVLAVDEFIDLLRKKLSSDSIFKDLIFSTKYPTIFNYSTPENTFSDLKVAALMSRLYSKKVPTTTPRSTENDLLNSTFLVDLVESVIFRTADRPPGPGNSETFQDTYKVSPIKIQAELGEVQQNNDFTGHYFFPEDDGDETTTETTEMYYDSSVISITDIMSEIEGIRKDTTSDFVEDILDLDLSTEKTTTTTNTIVPDVISSYHSGRNIMKKFLEDIKEKSA